MRIKLKKGKQKELILKAKKDLNWKEFASKIGLHEGYLKSSLRIERTLLEKETYHKLCSIAKINFNKHIEKELEENWGRSKGGINSPKNQKKIFIPKRNEMLAEIIGIILGDGHVEELIISKKIRCYSIIIAGNMKTDHHYMTKYIPTLFKEVFKEKGKISYAKNSAAGYFKIHGKELVQIIKNQGVQPGNKKANNQGIPEWIKGNVKFLKKCVRGLIDTDGSIHKISKNHKNLRIDYTSHIPKLLEDVRLSLIKLGFKPSKTIKDRHIFLTGKESINNYLNIIGFGNKKNLNRVICLQNQVSPHSLEANDPTLSKST